MSKSIDGEQKDGEPGTERPALRLKPLNLCPKCGMKVAEGSVLCPSCGWNFRTRKTMRGAETAMRRKQAAGQFLKWAGALLALVALVSAAMWVRSHRDTADRWLGEGVERAKGLAGQGGNPLRLDRERERLERDFPMWNQGERVTLEKTNGSVVEGVLSSVGGGVATVETADGVRTVELSGLSGRCRVRLDFAYREEILRARAGKD